MITPNVEQIRANCTPLGVKVAMFRRKDRYYVKLSLTKEVQHHEWINKWGGFYNFAIGQVKPFYWDADLTSSTVTSATFFIGTFFDFIKGDDSSPHYRGTVSYDTAAYYAPYIPTSLDLSKSSG